MIATTLLGDGLRTSMQGFGAMGLAGVYGEADATPAQIALAWLYAKGRALGLAVVPIPGTRRAARIDENAAALDVVLAPEHVAALDAASADVVGDRSAHGDVGLTSEGRERG